MAPEHPRTGIAHDDLHLIAVRGTVAVDRAVDTSRFARLEHASLEPSGGVVQQALALLAKRVVPAMLVTTEDTNHRREGPVFALESWMRQSHVSRFAPGGRPSWQGPSGVCQRCASIRFPSHSTPMPTESP
jgi:hypothetical protein